MDKKLIAMDMDGTLTQHKSELEESNRTALLKLQKKYSLVIVGAGSCERIHRQMQFNGIDIIGYYGMQMMFWQTAKNGFSSHKDEKHPVDKQEILKKMDWLRKTYHYENYVGESVEFHDSGIVTLPLLGTGAALEDKLLFDPHRTKRREIYAGVSELFGSYTVFIGGSSSFDMAPLPYNKHYALSEYADIKGFRKDEILYIGDDYGMGGNDSQIYHSDIDFLKVDNYRDFPQITADLL